jgi:RNA polymerase sigma factor (sigma-70 family)
MGIIELLNEYPFLDGRIEDIHKKIAEAKAKKQNAEDSLKATQITDMPHNPNVIDLVCELVTEILEKYANVIARLLSQELDLMTQKAKTENLLKTLTPEEYNIIKLRYFDGKDFRQIGRALFLSKSRVWEKHQEIIKKLEAKKPDKIGQENSKNGQISEKLVI